MQWVEKLGRIVQMLCTVGYMLVVSFAVKRGQVSQKLRGTNLEID